MTRGLSSDIKTQLASSSFVMAHLVKLEFNSTFRFTDYSSDIYVGSGDYVVTKDGDVLADYAIITKIGEYDSLQEGMTVTSNRYGIASGSVIERFKGASNPQVWLDRNTEMDAVEGTHTLTFTKAGVSEIFTANSFLQGMGAITESSKLTIGSIDLVLSGVNQTIISDLLNNGHLNKKVTIQRAYINSSTNALIEAISIFSGRVDGMQINDSDEKSEISLTVSNHWSDFNRKAGRKTTSNSQQQYFPADKGFDFITYANLT